MNFQRNTAMELLKEGSRTYSEPIYKNIEAVKNLAQITKTSYGPNGMNKMVINHLEKLFVTHDAATIINELEVVHPAAKLVVLASQAQEQECGDGTNFVLCLAGELLTQAENLLHMGLHTSDIITGFNKALEKAYAILEKDAVIDEVKNVLDKGQVCKAMKGAISSKTYGYEDLLVPLITEACINVCPKNPRKFNIDNVRVVKIAGGSVSDTYTLKGFCIPSDSQSSIKHVKKAKIAVYSCSIDASATETGSTVLIKNAEDLTNYNLSEEKALEKEIKALSEAGFNVIVTQGSFGEMALHFIQRYNMMAVKCSSKFQIRRLCKAVGATILVRLGVPMEDEAGNCETVDIEEIGDTKVTIFRQDEKEITSGISTIIVRGATANAMDEIERAVDDGVNVFKTLVKDNRLVGGAGAVEMQLYQKLLSFAEQTPGLDQYALRKFAESFLVIPKTLAESAGFNATDIIAHLSAAHQSGSKNMGVDVESPECMDVVKEGIYDCYSTKYWGIKLATTAVINILRVDQIIMARPAGGPKPPKRQQHWDED